MAGFASITGDEAIVYCDNVSFDGTQRGGKLTTDGELLIGSTTSPHIRKGNLTATPGTGVSVTNGSGGIAIAGIIATDSVKGVATFDENDFVVSSGDVNFANRTRLRPGYVENIGIDYNGGTGVFTVQGADTSLSATNPGFICLQSKDDPGELILYEITADQSFIDDAGASEIINNLFGLTTGVAYAQDIPFFLYGVSNDNQDTIAFMISRNPCAKLSPAAASIGAPDDAVADTQASFFSFDNIDETLYDSNPCLCIGAFRMQMSSSDDWTAQALTNLDGIGQFHDQTWFILPANSFGASTSTTGSYVVANAGTEPVFTSNTVRYKIGRDGMCDLTMNLVNVSTAGIGANQIEIILPYSNDSLTGHRDILSHFRNGGTGAISACLGTINAGSQQMQGFVVDSSAVFLTNANFATTNDLAINHRYGVFPNV